MRDDAGLLRLAEMGIEVYALRGAAHVAFDDADTAPAQRGTHALAPRKRVVLFTREEDAAGRSMLAQIARALAFARIDALIESSVDEARLGDAVGLVVFGKNSTRHAGGAVPGERMRRLQWIAATDIGEIAAKASAKRALWSELRRMLRAIAG